MPGPAKQDRQAAAARGEKLCSRCKTFKPFAAFSRTASRKGGLSDWCRACKAVYNAAQYAVKAAQPRPAACELRRVLSYDPATGVLAWRKHRDPLKIGTDATYRHTDNYRALTLSGFHFYAHVVAVVIMTGAWPVKQIDHLDGARSNNRWSNLREATLSQQRGNTRARRDNTSGHRGVTWYPRARKWRAHIHIDGRQKYLGSFIAPEEAARAYDKAAFKRWGLFSSLNFSVAIALAELDDETRERLLNQLPNE